MRTSRNRDGFGTQVEGIPVHDRCVEDHDDALEDAVFDPALLVGTWSNGTRVRRGRDEITIDFYRLVPERSLRLLVIRALVPPLVAVELRDQLDEAWQGYHGWSMPE
jgi:hypothetical protein